MKKIFMIGICGFILTGLLGCNNTSTQTNADTEPTKNVQNQESVTNNKYERYKLNEVGKTGNYQLKTVSSEIKNQIETFDKTFSTDNQYVIVNIEIAANDKTIELGYSPLDFTLADKEGKTYSCADITNELNVTNSNNDSNYVGIYHALNPGVFKKAQLVFETPKDVIPQVLANKNDGSTDYVEFELE